ncbi:hypothetical protein [Gracilibacillus halophilus]|nr:hypothetical protein [Gracilibacillus halophilus]
MSKRTFKLKNRNVRDNTEQNFQPTDETKAADRAKMQTNRRKQ